MPASDTHRAPWCPAERTADATRSASSRTVHRGQFVGEQRQAEEAGAAERRVDVLEEAWLAGREEQGPHRVAGTAAAGDPGEGSEVRRGGQVADERGVQDGRRAVVGPAVAVAAIGRVAVAVGWRWPSGGRRLGGRGEIAADRSGELSEGLRAQDALRCADGDPQTVAGGSGGEEHVGAGGGRVEVGGGVVPMRGEGGGAGVAGEPTEVQVGEEELGGGREPGPGAGGAVRARRPPRRRRGAGRPGSRRTGRCVAAPGSRWRTGRTARPGRPRVDRGR